MNEQDFVIDREVGINYCGGMEELYGEILQDFANDAETRLSNLDKFYKEADWKNYAIEAHAVKTTAKTVGAENFSEHSRLHEYAAKEENIAYIKEDYDNYIETFKELVRRIKA